MPQSSNCVVHVWSINVLASAMRICTFFLLEILAPTLNSIAIVIIRSMNHRSLSVESIYLSSIPSNSQHECVSNVTLVAALLLTPHHNQPWISLKLHIKFCTLDDKLVACPTCNYYIHTCMHAKYMYSEISTPGGSSGGLSTPLSLVQPLDQL